MAVSNDVVVIAAAAAAEAVADFAIDCGLCVYASLYLCIRFACAQELYASCFVFARFSVSIVGVVGTAAVLEYSNIGTVG